MACFGTDYCFRLCRLLRKQQSLRRRAFVSFRRPFVWEECYSSVLLPVIITNVYFDRSGKVVKFDLSTERPLRIPPGSYFHAFVTGSYGVGFRSYALMAMPSRPTPSIMSEGIQDLTFVLAIQPLPKTIRKLTVGQKLWLDGPYGPTLAPEARENVVLVAEGIGILGVLPIALHIATRKLHDMQNGQASLRFEIPKAELLAAEAELSENEQRQMPADHASMTSLKEKIAGLKQRLASDKTTERNRPFRDLTRKITILWVLDDNSQVRWVDEQIHTLQNLDPNNVRCVSKAGVLWSSLAGNIILTPSRH